MDARLARIGAGVKLHCANHAWRGGDRRRHAMCADVHQAARDDTLA